VKSPAVPPSVDFLLDKTEIKADLILFLRAI
jgi:hypothetical protein